MDPQLMTLLFRTFSILLGLVIAANSYSKFHHKNSKVWLYFAGFGFGLFLWASFNLMFVVLELEKTRIFFSIVLVLFMAVCLGLAASRMLFRFYRIPEHLVTGAIFAFFVVLTISAMMMNENKQFILQKILTVSLMILCLALVFSIYVYLKYEKRAPIVISLAAFFLAIAALIIIIHYGNCCARGGEMMYRKFCYGYDLDYFPVLKIPCSQGLVQLGPAGQVVLLTSIALLYAALYLWDEKEFSIEIEGMG